jgi:hypothetical protein
MGLGLIFQNFDGTGMGLGLKIFRILITSAHQLNSKFDKTLKIYLKVLSRFDIEKD